MLLQILIIVIHILLFVCCPIKTYFKWNISFGIQVVRSTGPTECPICLGTPVAGRTGLCGHVYCWPCILHYAATHDKQPPPCPVCHAALQVKEMKPTRTVQWESPSEEVNMIMKMYWKVLLLCSNFISPWLFIVGNCF